MNDPRDTSPNLAVFCDFENVALGVRDAKYEKFDIRLVLGRLLDKGKVVVKKAYSDWERYKSARKPLHEAGFELIEIPHVSYSGKNSADIRLVVDALDLCYTKTHVDVFVIVSGDSDFSPLVSMLRENDKVVVGVGVRNSTSDLLVDSCDEFIFYDDLVRSGDKRKAKGGRRKAEAKKAEKGKDGREPKEAREPRDAKEPQEPKDTKAGREPKEAGETKTREPRPARTEAEEEKRLEAIELVLAQVESLFQDRDESLWGSMIKQTLKRKNPGFTESSYGYRSFNELLEDAERRKLLELEKDAKSGGYLVRGFGPEA